MPAVSKAQQRFMGMVHAAQKGDMENPSPEVSKAAASMSDKDAKDFASTKHKGLPNKVKECDCDENKMNENGTLCNECGDNSDYAKQMKEVIRKMVREFMTQRTIDEMTGSGAAGAYNTPFAFTKPGGQKSKAKKQADLTGYSVVNELTERDVNRILQSTDNDEKLELTLDDGKKVVVQRVGKNSQGPTFKHIKNNKPVGTASALAANYIKNIKRLDLKENRWLELKKDESTAQAKIGRGISNINKQLAEMERFLNWYGKIKNESGVDNKSYWKRTNSHVSKIQERLIKLDQKIRQISE